MVISAVKGVIDYGVFTPQMIDYLNLNAIFYFDSITDQLFTEPPNPNNDIYTLFLIGRDITSFRFLTEMSTSKKQHFKINLLEGMFAYVRPSNIEDNPSIIYYRGYVRKQKIKSGLIISQIHSAVNDINFNLAVKIILL
jgi:hypothetical protein